MVVEPELRFLGRVILQHDLSLDKSGTGMQSHCFRTTGHLARHSERGKKTRHAEKKKRWEDNIRGWTGLEFAESQRAVESRE